MASSVIFDDLELFLVTWYREFLAGRAEPVCAGVEVDRVEPPTGPFPDKLVVVRFDGSTRDSIVTDESTVGISVLAGSKVNPKDAVDLARIVRAGVELIPSMTPTISGLRNPVAAVRSATGPIAVTEEQDRARLYITADLAVVGYPF